MRAADDCIPSTGPCICRAYPSAPGRLHNRPLLGASSHILSSLSFFSLYVCLIVQRTPLTLLPFALPRFFFRISWVVAAGAWEGGERYKGTSICRYLLDVPFHISPCEDFIIHERYLRIVIYYVNLQLGRTYHRFCRIKIYSFFIFM